VGADAEAVGDGAAGVDRPERGEPRRVVPEIVEELGPVPEVAGHERQGVEVFPDAEAVGNGSTGRDRPEGGEARLDVR
jgi:hypothetical protein